MRHAIRSQRGGALLVVMVLLGMGAFLSAALLRVTSYSRQRSHDVVVERQADYSAMAGIEAAMADIRRDPDRFLQEGATWEPLEGTPADLDFQVELTKSDGIYILSSRGGSDPHQVVYTLRLKKKNYVWDYAIALGGFGEMGLVLDPSAKEISVFGGPIYVEGDLYVNHNEKKDYAIFPEDESFPVIVTGRAYIGQNRNHERDLTAADLNASQLIVGAAPVGMDRFLAEAVDYLLGLPDRLNSPGGPVLVYNPDAWGIYESKSPRVVVVDGSLGCGGDDGWGNAGKNRVQKFYGTLIVKEEICQPSSMKGLEVHGSLLAGGIDLNAKWDALSIYYDPTYMPPVLERIPGAGTARIVLIDTEVEH